mgnify:CR=1 FL=1
MSVCPFVLASRYPNGAVAVSTIGRNVGREYVTEKVAVSISVDRWDIPIGLFGYFKEVTMVFPSPLKTGSIRFLRRIWPVRIRWTLLPML